MTDYPSLWADFWAILRSLWTHGTASSTGLARKGIAAEKRYRAFCMRWLIRILLGSLSLTGTLCALALAGSAPSWVFSLGTLVLGSLAITGLLIVIPYLWALAISQEILVVGPEIRRVLRWITIAAFSSILLATASEFLPLWQNPAILLRLILLIIGAVLGARLGLVLVPKQYVAGVVTLAMVLLFLVTVVGLVAPESPSWLRSMMGSIGPHPKALVIDLNGESPFRDSQTGEAVGWNQIWYIRRPRGEFEVFDHGGQDPRTGGQLDLLDTPGERMEVLAWIVHLRAEAGRLRKEKSESLAAAMEQRKARDDSTAVRARDDSIERAQAAALRVREDGAIMLEADARRARTRKDSVQVERQAVVDLSSELSQSAAEPRAEWLRELQGVKVSVRYSPASRQLAARLLQRLRAAKVLVELLPDLDRSPTSAPAIDYTQSEIHTAEALGALIADLGSFDLNSHRASTPLVIVLP